MNIYISGTFLQAGQSRNVSILLIPHPGAECFGPDVLAGVKQMKVPTMPFISMFASLSGRPNITLFVWAPRYSIDTCTTVVRHPRLAKNMLVNRASNISYIIIQVRCLYSLQTHTYTLGTRLKTSEK